MKIQQFIAPIIVSCHVLQTAVNIFSPHLHSWVANLDTWLGIPVFCNNFIFKFNFAYKLHDAINMDKNS